MDSDAVFFPPTPEGGLIDAQNVSCFLKRSCRSENVPDMLFFDLFEGDGVADLGARIGRGDAGRQKLRADPLATAEDDGSLDDIA